MKVHLPYTVTVGSTELAPGDYEIFPAHVTSNGNYFEIYSDTRESIEALVSATPTSKMSPAHSTELVLHENGHGEYTLDQMWIEGAMGGFEFATSTRERQAGTVELNADPAR